MLGTRECGGLGQVLVHGVVRQQEGGRHLVTTAPDVSLLTEEREAGHGHQHCLHVNRPEIHEVDHFQLDVSLPARNYFE